MALTVGLPGTGKTTEARRIEAERGALRLTKDEWVKALHGRATSEHGWERHRAAAQGATTIVAGSSSPSCSSTRDHMIGAAAKTGSSTDHISSLSVPTK